MGDRKRTRPSSETREAERREARAAADAGREPTVEEEDAAHRDELDEDVAEHYEEMTERGAEQRGEGRVPWPTSQGVLSVSGVRSQSDPRQSAS